MTDAATCVWIGLGSNQSWPIRQVYRAASRLSLLEGVDGYQLSSLYRSTAWGGIPQPDYINAVLQLTGRFEPRRLLGQLFEIERAAGRIRGDQQWVARSLDLDLLLCDQLIIDTDELTVPHPRLHLRDFVLRPLAECWPDLMVPERGTTAALLQASQDKDIAERLTENQINQLRQAEQLDPGSVV